MATSLIDTNGLKTLIEQDSNVMIVDAMPFKDSYKKEHIPSAKQFEFPIPDMPEWDPALTDQQSVEEFTQLLGQDKSKTLVFYCGFVKCGRSHNAAAWAVKLGYTNVYRYPGGIFAWKGAGFQNLLTLIALIVKPVSFEPVRIYLFAVITKKAES